MSVKVELVDLGESPSTSSQRGFPRTVIPLERNNQTNINFAQGDPISRSVLLEGIDGDGSIEPRRKLRRLMVEGTLTTDQLRDLHALKEEERPLWWCPNVGPTTLWSVPLFAGLDALVGPTLSYSRATGIAYSWDASRQVIDKHPAGEIPIAFGGPYGRYAQPASFAYTNKAAKPHPDSTTTGWTLITGVGGQDTINYDDERPTPLLANRGTANSQGMAILSAYGITGSVEFEHAATGLTSGGAICAVLYVEAPYDITVNLLKADGSTADTAAVTGSPGVVQRVALIGAQSAAGTTADLRVVLDNAVGESFSVFAGPVFIGNANSSTAALASVPDWADATGTVAGVSGETSSGFTLAVPELTISFLARYSDNAWGAVELDSTTDFGVYFDPTSGGTLYFDYGLASVNASLASAGLTVGDWMHVVCTLTGSAATIYVNGTQRGTTALGSFIDGYFSSYKSIGGHASGARKCEGDAGLLLLRLDAHAWSADEISRHRETYARAIGRAMVTQNFGRTFVIDSIGYEIFSVDADKTLYTAEITLRQLKQYDEFAPVRIDGGF